MATPDRSSEATPGAAEAVTKPEPGAIDARPAVAPRPVTLPPRPASSPSSTPLALPKLGRLSETTPRSGPHQSKPSIPQPPRIPALPPPLPPPGGQPASMRLRAPPVPPPLPTRPSAIPRPNGAPPPPLPKAPAAASTEDDSTRTLQLQALLGQTKQALASKDAELRTVLAQRDLLRSELTKREAELKQHSARTASETALRARIAELEHTSADLSARLAESENLLARTEQRVRELEEELARARREPAVSPVASVSAPEPKPEPQPGAANEEDDLKRIRGIGPAFERALKALGIRRYAQIAALRPKEIEAIAKQIRTSAERIRKDGWVERARELARGGNG